MKNTLLLIATILFSLQLQAQNCDYTYTFNGTTTTAYFAHHPTFTNPPYHFFWDFGDGTSSTSDNPTHTFNVFGSWIVCCSVLDSLNNVICSSCDTVSPNGTSSCIYSYAPDVLPLTMIFAGSPSGSGGNMIWDFGDGSVGTGSTITHTFPASNTYWVCMSELDTNGNVLCTYCDSIFVSGGTTGTCSFTATPDSIVSGLVYFQAQANAGATITWNFGDNTSGSGDPIQHQYNGVGPWLVCMTATDFNGTCTSCDTVYAGNPSGGICSFTATNISGTLSVVVVAQPFASGSTIIWDMGDGGMGTGSPLTYTYALAGPYTICMTELDSATSNILCTTCMTVIIGNPPNTLCQSNFAAVSAGLTGYFMDLSSVDLTTATFVWDFGDGGSSTARYPQHTYSNIGTYNVCLSIADANGCSDVHCDSLVVDTTFTNPLFCNAYFVVTQTSPFQMTVVNLSTGVNLSFLWDFGDGSTSTQAYPSHYYTTTGSYVLCLTVTSNAGATCTSTYCDTLTVDSAGNIIYRGMSGFTINVVSPTDLTGVGEQSALEAVSVYPNPVSSGLNIVLPENVSEASYKISSVTGALVSTGAVSPGTFQVNTDDWSRGIYILELSQPSGAKIFRKLVKE